MLKHPDIVNVQSVEIVQAIRLTDVQDLKPCGDTSRKNDVVMSSVINAKRANEGARLDPRIAHVGPGRKRFHRE